MMMTLFKIHSMNSLWEDRVGTAGNDSPAGEIHPMDTDNGKAQVGLVIHDLLTSIYHR